MQADDPQHARHDAAVAEQAPLSDTAQDAAAPARPALLSQPGRRHGSAFAKVAAFAAFTTIAVVSLAVIAHNVSMTAAFRSWPWTGGASTPHADPPGATGMPADAASGPPSLAGEASAGGAAAGGVAAADAMERGTAALRQHDVGGARLWFNAAYRAGEPAAAVYLGLSFDPAYLLALGEPALADAQQAQLWYGRARAAGGDRISRMLEFVEARYHKRGKPP